MLKHSQAHALVAALLLQLCLALSLCGHASGSSQLDARFAMEGFPPLCSLAQPLQYYPENECYERDQSGADSFLYSVGELDARESNVGVDKLTNPNFNGLNGWHVTGRVSADGGVAKANGAASLTQSVQTHRPNQTVCLTARCKGHCVLQVGSKQLEHHAERTTRLSVCGKETPTVGSSVNVTLRTSNGAEFSESGSNPVFRDRDLAVHTEPCSLEDVFAYESSWIAERLSNKVNHAQHWAVANEPNWFPHVEAADYAAYFASFHALIKSLDPSAKLVVGAVFAPTKTWVDLYVRKLLEGLKAHNVVPDVFSTHVYPEIGCNEHSMRQNMESIARYRELVAETLPEETWRPMWVTEFGPGNWNFPSRKETDEYMERMIGTFSSTGIIDRWFWFNSNANPSKCGSLGEQDKADCINSLCIGKSVTTTGTKYTQMASGGVNLVDNGSFESGLDAWMAHGAVVVQGASAYDSWHFLRLSAEGSNVTQPVRKVSGGNSGTQVAVNLRMRCSALGASLLVQGKPTECSPAVKGNNDAWTHVRVTMTAGELGAQLALAKSGAANVQLDVDAVSVSAVVDV